MALALLPTAGSDGPTERADTIGLVTNNPNGMRNVTGFIDGMAELGYVEGDNVEYLFAEQPVQGADLTNELTNMVSAGVDLIFTAGTSGSGCGTGPHRDPHG